MSRIQFKTGMSLSQFLELYVTEEQCEAALEQTRWPNGFRCPRCGEQEHGLVYDRSHRRINAGAAFIRRQSMRERSWKPPSP